MFDSLKTRSPCFMALRMSIAADEWIFILSPGTVHKAASRSNSCQCARRFGPRSISETQARGRRYRSSVTKAGRDNALLNLGSRWPLHARSIPSARATGSLLRFCRAKSGPGYSSHVSPCGQAKRRSNNYRIRKIYIIYI